MSAGPEALNRLRQAQELHQQGRHEEAESRYRDVLAVMPDQADALHLLGVLEAQRGRYETAADLIGRAASIASDNPFIHYNYGNVLSALNRPEESLASFDRALALNPGDSITLNNKGVILCQLKRTDEALISYERAIALNPEDSSAHINRGNLLLGLGKYEEALSSYGRALAIRPQQANALFGRGKALGSLLRYEDALASYDRAIALDPVHAESHANRGDVLFQIGRYNDALLAYEKAAAIAPDSVAAHNGRGNALFKLGRGREAYAAYDRAFSLNPEMEYLEGTRLLTKMYVCDWSDLQKDVEHLRARVLEGKPAANPFAFLMIGENPSDQMVCARAYAAAKYPPSPIPMWRGGRSAHSKIRVGYVSGEFREQATGYLTADLFECHDRSAFELHAISTGIDDASAMRKRIKAAFDVFSDVSRRSDSGVADEIARADIDILVNLNGFFGEERTGLFAFKPAPIQVNYLGFPGTMGAPYMDYILADRWIIPDDRREDYSERVVYLPDTYQANDRKKAIGDTLPSRAEYGLPEKGFVFCSFNNAYKITPEIFSIWMRLLASTDGSVLWLLEVDSAIERNLLNEAQKRGVSPDRILFSPFIKLKDHLARGRLADLFLDTLPVNAHTTASDALWMGVPVLTCLGSTFAGRVAASLLAAVGLEEMITRSLADYEALALKLATDPALMASVRGKLARNRDTYPLFDTPRFARHIEAAYKKMWERHQSGLAPAGFAVDRIDP
ncbi:MAG TPA: tetratricopeptide repeat protein [Micropepsaceae bacterium]|nr:tetratricopeptide repeat protein [Micropepsaceae bacterium]